MEYIIYRNNVPEAVLQAWSEATRHELHLVHETIESLRENVPLAVVAFDGEEVAGCAGLVLARSSTGHLLEWAGKTVVELGGAYVDAAYRKHGVWRELLRHRLASADAWQVVCISSNPTVQHGLPEFGLIPMDELWDDLKAQLCICPNVSPDCSYCPFTSGAAWVLP